LHSPRIKPCIFSLDNSLIDVLVEEYQNFNIYWFHWPRDGVYYKEQDYEPVIIIYDRDGQICYLIIRRGWGYKQYSVKDILLPPQVMFDPVQHHPYVRTKKIKWAWNASEEVRQLIHIEYTPSSAAADTIPTKFRTGEGHESSNFRAVSRDPIDEATERHQQFCS